MNDMRIPGIDPARLRRALGRFATGITIVATRTPAGAMVGLTVNSFSSVSLSPPLILWSVARTAASFQAFVSCPVFSVNVLAEDQRPLAERFARSGGEKFAGIAMREGLFGVPLFDGTIANFTCKREACYPGGDHMIVLGEVLACEQGGDRPLLYALGQYLATGTPVER